MSAAEPETRRRRPRARVSQSRRSRGGDARDILSPNARIAGSVCAVLLGLFFAFPLVWALFSSFKTSAELFSYPPKLLPENFQWGNYRKMFQEIPFARYLLNSLTVALLSVVGDILSCSLVAYGFVRFRFPLRRTLFMLVLASLMLPDEVVIIPQFLLFRELGWLDSLRPLIAPAFVAYSGFNVFLFRQFFLGLPNDLDDAAMLDGASSLRIWWSIYLPLSKPVIATVGVLSFLYHWNDFLRPLIYLNQRENFTLTLGLQAFAGTATTSQQPQQQLLMAAAVMMTVPVVLLFALMGRYITSGLSLAGVQR